MRRKVEHWKAEFVKKYSVAGIVIIDTLEQLEEVLAPTLFAAQKLIILKDVMDEHLFDLIERLPKDYFLMLWQTKKLDRRLSLVKKLFSLKINFVEFKLPHGKELNVWIEREAKLLGVKIDPEAIEKLAQFLGRDLFEEKKLGGKVVERKEAFDLWQVSTELSKLAARTSHIKVSDVTSLVSPKVSENIFALSDAVINREQKKAQALFETLISQTPGDEKTALIKILALLGEQIRSQLLVGTLSSQRLDNAAIAQNLGWSAGRVFVTLRHYRHNPDELKKLLSKLLKIDEQLKTSDLNPRLLLNLFIAKT